LQKEKLHNNFILTTIKKIYLSESTKKKIFKISKFVLQWLYELNCLTNYRNFLLQFDEWKILILNGGLINVNKYLKIHNC